MAATSRAGSTIKVLSQIQSVEDVRLAYDNGADGIGELKPEIVFNTEGLNSGLADVIHAIRTTTPWQTIPIRFFDFTSDKPSPDGTVASQGALAFRGIRLCEIYDSLIERFLLALDRVAAPDIVIVLPMVTLPYEVEAFRDRVSKRRLRVGILVETPAAALVIEDFLNLCDYIEIGINDLTQFTMAWDRTIPHHLRLPSDRVVEPVARLISKVSRAAERKKAFSALAVDLRPTTELASQLMGLGVTAITVSPRLIPLWKEAIRNS